MTTRQEHRRSLRSVSPRKEARRPVEEPPSPTPPAEPAEETPREATDPRSTAGGKVPSNNVHRRALRSVSPRKEARKSTGQQVEPLPPAGPPSKRDEPAKETTGAVPKAGGKMPTQNSHRKAMRSVSPRKEARKSTDKGSNPPPPAETARPPPEAEEPEVELRRPSMLSKWYTSSKMEWLIHFNKTEDPSGIHKSCICLPNKEGLVQKFVLPCPFKF